MCVYIVLVFARRVCTHVRIRHRETRTVCSNVVIHTILCRVHLYSSFSFVTAVTERKTAKTSHFCSVARPIKLLLPYWKTVSCLFSFCARIHLLWVLCKPNNIPLILYLSNIRETAGYYHFVPILFM